MRVDRVRVPLLCIAAAVATLALASCGDKQSAPAAPPPAEVGVITVQPTPVAVTTELPGRTSAYLIAEVRARNDGIVLSRDFKEGTDVKQGQRLYQIDPKPFQAQLDSAKATLAKAQANLVTQTAQAQRFKTLVAGNAVSKQDYDNAVATEGQAAADVAAGKAAVQTASINLGYTNVVSPITGRIGKSQVTEGAYVQASAATLLSTVQQIDPIYVDVAQSSNDALRLRRELQDGKLQSAGQDAAKVSIVLDDGTVFPQSGTLEFSDITVDPNTGTVTLRAVVPNPQHMLLPGMFVRARLQEAVDNHAILVPEQGITHDQRGIPNALVVGPDNKVSVRTLQTSRTFGSSWVVTGGLNPGDRVIVQGVQKARPGSVVKPVAAVLPAPAGAASAPDAASAATAQGSSASSSVQAQ